MWHPSRPTRIALGVLGVLAVLIGLAGWSLETEYGGQGPGEMEMLPDGTVKVYDIDEQQVDDEGHPSRTLVFEGTEADAEAWVEDRRSQGRNYAIPLLIIAGGAASIVGSVFPPVGARKPDASGPT